MQVFAMHSHWLEMERYRLSCVEAWEEGRRKQATLAAIRSTISSLSQNTQAGVLSAGLTRKQPTLRPRLSPVITQELRRAVR